MVYLFLMRDLFVVSFDYNTGSVDKEKLRRHLQDSLKTL